MVELDVRIEGGPVFITGETVHCTLTFSNTGKEPRTIAWASAQVHCQLQTRAELVKLKIKEILESPVTDTAFFPNRGEKGITFLSTDSKVLLCNVTLKPGEVKKVPYCEEIPSKGPPTFSGRVIRYAYKLTIGAQIPNCPAQINRIPIRVITIPSRMLHPQLTSPQSSNPFLNNEERHSSTELGLEAIAAEAGRRTNASYTLTSSGDTLGRIIVPRLSYRLGDKVTVILDNSCSVHQVLQVIATLVYTEKIQDGCLQPNAPVKPLTTLVARETRGCTNSLITHFTLPIPTGHTQSFTTETIAVGWELQFQLLISKVSWASTHSIDQSVGPGKTVAEVWKGPLPQKADTVNWALPLTILPSINTDTLLVQRQHVML